MQIGTVYIDITLLGSLNTRLGTLTITIMLKQRFLSTLMLSSAGMRVLTGCDGYRTTMAVLMVVHMALLMISMMGMVVT